MKIIPGCPASFLELIDTCWDVNSVHDESSRIQALELIDTCWDVNTEITSQVIVQLR